MEQERDFDSWTRSCIHSTNTYCLLERVLH